MDGDDVDMAAVETAEAVPVFFFPYFSCFFYFLDRLLIFTDTKHKNS
jgi:hypothetical protein